MWVEICRNTWMDCSLTSSISSLNMSTRKSRHFSAKLGEDRAREHKASTAAIRTSAKKKKKQCKRILTAHTVMYWSSLQGENTHRTSHPRVHAQKLHRLQSRSGLPLTCPLSLWEHRLPISGLRKTLRKCRALWLARVLCAFSKAWRQEQTNNEHSTDTSKYVSVPLLPVLEEAVALLGAPEIKSVPCRRQYYYYF